MLFLALGVLALLFYRDQRWGWLGAALGLLIITRLEGVALVLAIALLDVWRYRSVRGGLLVAGGITALICCPWILYLWLRTGNIIPTSGLGKHFSLIASI